MAMDLTKAMELAQEAQSRRAWRVETSADAPKTTLSAAAQRMAFSCWRALAGAKRRGASACQSAATPGYAAAGRMNAVLW